MRKSHLRIHAAVISGLLLLPAAAAIVFPSMIASLHRVDLAQVRAAARKHPAFTSEQRRAVLRAIRVQQHPQWRTLSPSAQVERAAAFAALWLRQKSMVLAADPAAPTLAPFRGNQTVIVNPSGNAIALRRMTDCSLSLYDGQYSVSGSSATVQITATTPHYEQVLHAEAGLTTQEDVFAGGCHDPTLGIGSRRGAYLGTTTNGAVFGAGTGFDPPQQANALYYGVVDLTSTAPQTGSGADVSLPGMTRLAAGDLNGDGLADVVGLDESSGRVAVWLAKADGTFAAPTTYSLGGTTTEGAVVVDVNNDDKPDVVVVTLDSSSHQEELWVLTNDGTGALTVGTPQAIPTPVNSDDEPVPMGPIVAADLRGGGLEDLIGANGLVLLNNGSGQFTAAAQQAFVPTRGTSDFGPNLAVGDFNNDGKLDLAVDDGEAIYLYLGNGDGSFTPGLTYASDNDVGYLTATDLDGDGNVDLYVGTANGGVFAGDQFGANQADVLMGNGDGSFGGAPYAPFFYTGTNLADLDGDGHLDAVGVNQQDYSLTSYLGDGKGDFVAKSTLQSSFTYNGHQYLPNAEYSGIDSYGLADVNGDGHPDLVYFIQGQVSGAQNIETPGFLVALGDGKGDFGTPTFTPTGHFAPGDDVDNDPSIANLRLADVNHDGKVDLVYSFTDEDFTTSTSLQGIAVQLGNGDGTFQAPITLLMPVDPGATYHVIAITDLNEDGKPDLMFTTSTIDSSNTVRYGLDVALGHGDGTFAAPAPVTTTDVMPFDVLYGTEYAPIVVADMNGDGIPDIVALGAASDGQGNATNLQIAIALGNGNGTFKAPSKTNLSAAWAFDGLAVADFNGDGKLDVAIAGVFPPSDTGIVLGNGDGTLAPLSGPDGLEPNEVFYLSMYGPAVAADFNGDGKPDLLAGQTVLINETGAPSSVGDFALAANPTSLSVKAGDSGTTTLTISPTGGFSEPISFGCSGLPAGASCSFSPSTVTPNGGAATTTLTVATSAQSAMLWLGGTGSVLASFGLILVRRRKRSAPSAPDGNGATALLVSLAALVPAAVLAGTLLVACGGDSSHGTASSSGSGAGGSTSTVTVTATASGADAISHTTTITLTVQ